MAQSGASARRRAGHRQGPPRLGLQGAARPDRGRPQARPAALRGRDQQPRARHRHGRGRPGHPDRVAAQRRQRPPAGRPRRPPGRRGQPRRAVPQAPRRPRPDRGRGRADAHRRHRVAARARPTRSTCSPSRSWPPTALDAWAGRRPLRRWSAAAAPFAAAPAQRATTRPSTCSPAATPPTSSPSCARASSGTGSPAPLTGRPGAQRLAVTSGGTIPDRGLFGVFLVGGEGPGRRVGELDEEMVYESRVGDVFALGATSWRIEDITHDRVLVTPAPGIPGRLPFWKGDTLGRPGRARRGRSARSPASSARCRRERAEARAPASDGLDDVRRRQPGRLPRRAARGHQRAAQRPAPSWSSGSATSSATGGWSCTPPTAPRSTRPWALAINARLRERYGVDGQAVASDDGIVIRIPDTDAEPPGGEVVVFEPDEIEDAGHRGGRRVGAVRRPASASAPPAPCCSPAATPAGARRCGSSASARAALLEVAAQVPVVPDRARGGPRVPPGRLRPARRWSR